MKSYVSPALREKALLLEREFLESSNTEPIGGGDDPDIDW